MLGAFPPPLLVHCVASAGPSSSYPAVAASAPALPSRGGGLRPPPLVSIVFSEASASDLPVGGPSGPTRPPSPLGASSVLPPFAVSTLGASV